MRGEKSGVRPTCLVSERVWFRVLVALLLVAPVVATRQVPPEEISLAISQVLSHPLATTFPALLVVAKAALVLAFFVPLLLRSDKAGVALLAYYGVILLVVGLFQNMSVSTDYGFVWVIGNTAAQWIVAGFVAAALGRVRKDGMSLELHPERTWMIVPIALALLEPYGVGEAGNLVPAFDLGVLTNDTGVTYCMITPVVLGTMLVWGMDEGPAREAVSLASYVGLLFGILNLATWFVFMPASWWMGVLHLPLVVVSVAGMAETRRRRGLR